MNQSGLDSELVQSRVMQTLVSGTQVDLSTEPCKQFLKRSVGKKVNVVILYVDIIGSTRMSLTLSDKKFAQIIQVFSQEMSLVATSHGGYVFKYVGDAVIVLFPSAYDAAKVSESVIDCSRTMIEVLKKYVSPCLESRGLPPIRAKVAFDYGNVLVVPYGKKSPSSHIDIVGRTISIVAKMLPYAKVTNAIAGQAVYNVLHNTQFKELFFDSNADKSGWSYIDEKNGLPYKLYLLKME